MEIIPYDKRSGKIWFNGENIDWSKAQVHLLSHGLHYASCVFEGIRVYDGEIFKIDQHTDRLFHSAKRMGMNVPFSKEVISEATKQIVNIQTPRSSRSSHTSDLHTVIGLAFSMS